MWGDDEKGELREREREGEEGEEYITCMFSILLSVSDNHESFCI